MATIDASTPQLKVVQELIDAYVSLDISNLDTVLSKYYIHQTSPTSMDFPLLTREGYVERYGRVLPLFTKFELTIHEVIEAPGKVVGTDICSTIYGIEHVYETIYTFYFVEEDGELKLSRCKEFIDTKKHAALTAEIVKAIAEGALAS